jgi:hypothetical protein
MKTHCRLRFFLLQTSAASALLAASFVHAADLTFESSTSPGGTITVASPDTYTIAVGSSATRTLTNAITLGGGTLKGGVMDNVATVSGLSGAGTSSTFVDANGVTIILKGSGTTNTTANLMLASGISITGANQLLVGGGGGGGGGRQTRNDGGGGGGGFTVLTTGNLSGTLALTAGGGSAGANSGGGATASGGTSSIGATTAAGGGGAASSVATPTGKGGDSGRTISGTPAAFTGGNGFITPPTTGNGGGGGGAGSSANGINASATNIGGAGGAGTQITTGIVGLSGYLGSNTFGGGGGGGGDTTRGAGGAGGGGQGAQGGAGGAGTDGLGGGGGGGANGSTGTGGAGGAGSVAIQYAYNSNVAAGALTLSGGITLSSTSTLDAVRSGGLIDVTSAITGGGGLNIASSASSGGVVRLSATNTYTGATTVSAGKLAVNGSTSASSAVGVSSGGTLAGSGTVGGNATLASGGALAPGNSPGVLTVSGTTSFSSGSMFEWEIDTAQSNPTTNRGVAYDGLNTTAVSGSGAIFKVMLTGAQDFSDSFWDQTRTWTDIFKSADGSSTLSNWASVFSGGFQYSYNGTTVAPTSSGSFALTGNSLTWSAVPEPSNLLAGMLASGALLRRRRNS